MAALAAVTVALVGIDISEGPKSADSGPPANTAKLDQSNDAPAAAEAEPSASPTPSTSAQASGAPTASPVTVVQHGSGRFLVAPGQSKRVGTGRLMRYRVEVEQGSGQDPATFAKAVDSTLDDPRSWTAQREWAFQRVSSGSVDFVIKLSTPDTTDVICKTFGLDPKGYTSCRGGPFVVINLARWLLAVPEFRGDLATYRLYVINHEVGHRLGHGHMACPGRGRLAPVMQQQTLGLKGCKPNPWPFVNGTFISGPSVA